MLPTFTSSPPIQCVLDLTRSNHYFVQQSFTGFTLGDLVAQAPDMSKGKAWDVKRTAKMGAFGLALHGPIGHVWYGMLDRTIMVANPTSAAAVATKTAVDQILFAPVFTSMFFGAMKAMDGKPDEIGEEVKSKLWPTMKVNWTVYVIRICASIFSTLCQSHSL